jgi:NADH pyrophosphatase NudC (nudix superfamily)
MTLEVSRRTHQESTRNWVKAAVNHFEKRRAWTPCPRCIGGNMYQETNGEHVCIQCGCRFYPDRVTRTPVHQSQGGAPVISEGKLSA